MRLTMTLPFLDRAFDVIFVMAGDNKLGVVHEIFKMRNRCFKYPGRAWFSLRAETFFGCSMISLKLTVNQISPARISDARKQLVSVIRQN